MKYGATPLDCAIDGGFTVELCDLDFSQPELDGKFEERMFGMLLKATLDPNLVATVLEKIDNIDNPEHLAIIETIVQQHNLDLQVFAEIRSAFDTTPRNGADVNWRDENEEPPVISALLNANEEIALQLIAAGTELNVANNIGLIPFHAAYTYQLDRILNILFDRGLALEPTSLQLSWKPESPAHLEARQRLLERRQARTKSSDKYDRQAIEETEILISFFALDAGSQVEILPQLDREFMFNCSDGEVFTDNPLYGLAAIYKDDLDRYHWSLSEDKLYLAIHNAICSISHCIGQKENDEDDDFWRSTSLATPQWTLLRLLSQFIKQYFEIDREVTTADLSKCYQPLADNY